MSVGDATYGDLRTLVISGEVLPGTHLREVPLAERLGVSRPTVREALRRLESDGLAASDGRGLRVVRMEPPELRSALLMRAALEALHAELAARRVRAGEVAPAELRRLRQRADRAASATRRQCWEEAVEANRAFHQAIDTLADSPVSADAVDGLWDRILVSTERSLASPGRPEGVNREHLELLGAIEAGEEERAAEVARRHVLATLGTLE